MSVSDINGTCVKFCNHLKSLTEFTRIYYNLLPLDGVEYLILALLRLCARFNMFSSEAIFIIRDILFLKR